MKSMRYLLTLVLALNYCGVLYAANEPFSKGEIINYDIEKFKLKVGEAVLTFNGAVEVQGKEALLITFTASGFKFLDEEKIYIDAKTFYPILIQRNLSMFGKEERIMEFYDLQKGKVRIVKTAKGKTTEQVIENGERFDNIYGFIYRHRQLGQFNQKSKLDLHLPTSDIQFKFVQQKKFTIGDQAFNAIYMHSISKKFEVWFDSGPKHTPLKINGALGFGNMSMVFKGRQVEDDSEKAVSKVKF